MVYGEGNQGRRSDKQKLANGRRFLGHVVGTLLEDQRWYDDTETPGECTAEHERALAVVDS